MNIRSYQWSVLKKLLKQRFSELSDEDLVLENGNERELFVRLSRKIGKSQDDLARIIKAMQQAYLQQTTLL